MLKTVGNPSTRYGDQTIIDGNLVIGTAGKGIDFSADANTAGMTSEVLDDYEEGTFTAVLTGSSSGTRNMSGTYTKIGRFVKINIIFNSTIATSTFTGNLFVTGLPFPAVSSATAGQYGSGLLHIRGATTTGTAGAPIAIFNGAQINLHTSANLGTTTVTSSAAATFPATGITQNGVTGVQINWTFVYDV